MKPKARSRTNCLFCYETCPESVPILHVDLVLGAVGCTKLQQQLEHLFILRQLLDVPVSWCEKALARSDVPETWFRICSGCGEVVREAWQVHQKLLEVQSRMKGIKEKIKRGMRDSVKKRKGQVKEVNCIDNEIRRLVLCSSIVDSAAGGNMDVIETTCGDMSESDSRRPASPLSVDEDWDYDREQFSVKLEAGDEICEMSDDQDNEDDDEDEDYVFPEKGSSRKRKYRRGKNPTILPGDLAPQKPRKRGRTPNSEGPMDPAMYITHYGTYKKKEFSWNKCNVCSAKFKFQDAFQAHMDVHEECKQLGGQFDCTLCSFPCRNEDELNAHKNKRHGNLPKQVSREYSCIKCDYKTPVWKQLRRHAHQEHPDVPAEEFGLELQLTCEMCSKIFANRSALNIHQKKAHPEVFGEKEEVITCNQCGVRFPSKIILQYHINNTHLRIAKCVCDICGKGFRSNDDLDRHKAVREKKKEFVCHLCGVDYTYKVSLECHYKKFHPNYYSTTTTGDQQQQQGTADSTVAGEDSSETFRCKYCDLTSNFKVVIIRHMQTHKADMGHQCPECLKYYTSAQGLKRHKRINHAETKEQVQCPFCFKPFPTIDYMKNHMSRYCKVRELSEKSNNAEVVV